MAQANILGLVALCVFIIFAVSFADTMPCFRRMREPFLDAADAAGTAKAPAPVAAKSTSTASDQFWSSTNIGIMAGTIGGVILLAAIIFGRSKGPANPYIRE